MAGRNCRAAIGLPRPSRGQHQSGRDLDLAANLHGAGRLIFLRSHQDVREDVIAGDDAGHGLAQDLGLVEEMLEELGVVFLAEHAGYPRYVETSMQSKPKSSSRVAYEPFRTCSR